MKIKLFTAEDMQRRESEISENTSVQQIKLIRQGYANRFQKQKEKEAEEKAKFQLQEQPHEILFKILLDLPPEKIIAISALHSHFKQFCEDELFWKIKFQIHFPHLFETLQSINNISWYEQFKKAYNDEYKSLPGEIKNLFSIVKEEDIISLIAFFSKAKFQSLIPSDLLSLRDSSHVSLLSWAVKSGNQSILDYFFNEIILSYYNNDPNKTTREGYTLLHWAILCRQSVEILEQLYERLDNKDLNEIPGINYLSDLGHNATPLHLAAKQGHYDVTKLLIGNGANVNTVSIINGESLLSMAAYEGHAFIVEWLIEKKAKVNDAYEPGRFSYFGGGTPLCLASENSHDHIVELLLNSGANPNLISCTMRGPIYFAAAHGSTNMVKLLLEKGAKQALGKALYIAIKKGYLDIAELLINHGAPVDERDVKDTPLGLACKRGYSHLVKSLLEKGADPNLTALKVVRIPPYTPLSHAARSGHLEIVKLLLENKAIVNHEMGFCSPLINAASKGHVDIINELIKNEANINGVMDHGNGNITPVFAAAINGRLEAVKILVENKADINHECTVRVSILRNFCKENNKADVENFIQHKKSNSWCSLWSATDTRFIKINALIVAELLGHTEIVSYLQKSKSECVLC